MLNVPGERSSVQSLKVDMNTYILHWRDGLTNEVKGETIAHAMNQAGYGRGVLPALDYWEKKFTLSADAPYVDQVEKSISRGIHQNNLRR